MAKKNNDALYAMPEVTAIDDRASRAEVIVLLNELHALKDVSKEMDAKKKRLAELLREEGHDAIRFGLRCVSLRYQAGRKSFDRERAIDAGITPDQIDASMKEGASYTVVTLDEITEDA